MSKTEQQREAGKGIHPKYPSLRVPFVYISVFSYVMLGVAIVFFILGVIGIALPPLLIFLPMSFQLALSAFVLLIIVKGVQLLQDIEMNLRQMVEIMGKKT